MEYRSKRIENTSESEHLWEASFEELRKSQKFSNCQLLCRVCLPTPLPIRSFRFIETHPFEDTVTYQLFTREEIAKQRFSEEPGSSLLTQKVTLWKKLEKPTQQYPGFFLILNAVVVRKLIWGKRTKIRRSAKIRCLRLTIKH